MVLPILHMRKPRLQELFSARSLTILQPPAWAGEPLSTRSADPKARSLVDTSSSATLGTHQSAVGLIIKQGDLMKPAEPDIADARDA